MRNKNQPEAAKPVAPIIESFKGFDKNLACRGFQFEIGKTYSTSGKIEACKNGFHACENPFDVFNYYNAGDTSRYAIVEQSGELSRHDEDSKIASATITIKAELSLPDFIKRGVAWLVANAKTTLAVSGHAAATGVRGIASACGYAARAKAGPTGAIMLACISDDDYSTILAVRASKVGDNGIKPNVWYSLNANGDFVEETAP